MEKKIIKAITEIVDGKMLAIASDESIDRVGDSLKAKDWDLNNFNKNPVLQAGHDYRPQFTIGIAKNIITKEGKLIFEPIFHTITQLAREIKEMYEQGILKAWSVGYIPSEDGGKNELLEVSAVAVPANANALVIAKGMDSNQEKEVGEKIKEFIDGETKEEVKEEKPKEKKEEKSPMCRMSNETEKECMARKIPEIMRDDPNIKQDQAVAMAVSMCGKACESNEEKPKEEEKIFKIKERWNKQLSKSFDIDSMPSKPSSFQYEVYAKYLGCKVKNIYLNTRLIPCPMLGSYLNAIDKILMNYELKDERNFDYSGREEPLKYELIPLTIDKSSDYLIQGMRFYQKNDNRFMVKFYPTWSGLVFEIINKSTEREWNKNLLLEIQKYAEENNMLKGQIFGLSGEFLKKTEDKWEDLVLPKEVLEPIQKSIGQLKKNGKDAKSRGLMFIGKPGTGKTKTGKVLMNDYADASFIWVSTRDIVEIGPIEALRLSFDLSRKLAPSILFFEDIDSWIKTFGVDILKTEMDGIRENKGMIILLTSNNPEEFPDSLIDRPGRFHDVLDFVLPTKELREGMINKWAGEINKDILIKILEMTDGYSGAHMKELVDYAKMIVEDDGIEIGEALLKSLDKLVKQRELINKLKTDIKSMDDIVTKEGRVISASNKSIIEEAITAGKNAVSAMEKLLEISDTSSKGVEEKVQLPPQKVEGGENKGREPKIAHKELTANELAVHTLKEITKQTNFALCELNKKNK